MTILDHLSRLEQDIAELRAIPVPARDWRPLLSLWNLLFAPIATA